MRVLSCWQSNLEYRLNHTTVQYRMSTISFWLSSLPWWHWMQQWRAPKPKIGGISYNSQCHCQHVQAHTNIQTCSSILFSLLLHWPGMSQRRKMYSASALIFSISKPLSCKWKQDPLLRIISLTWNPPSRLFCSQATADFWKMLFNLLFGIWWVLQLKTGR